MAVETLRCRVCESEYPAIASGICLRCFGPLEPVYDWDDVAKAVSRERIAAGPRSLWRYEALLPTAAPARRGRRPRLDAARAARRGSRAALGIGELLPEARPHEPDALVQGPGRRRRGRQGGGARRPTRSPVRRPATSATRSPRAPRRAACARSSSIPRPSSRRSCWRRRCTAVRCTPCAATTTTARASSSSSRVSSTGRS